MGQGQVPSNSKMMIEMMPLRKSEFKRDRARTSMMETFRLMFASSPQKFGEVPISSIRYRCKGKRIFRKWSISLVALGFYTSVFIMSACQRLAEGVDDFCET